MIIERKGIDSSAGLISAHLYLKPDPLQRTLAWFHECKIRTRLQVLRHSFLVIVEASDSFLLTTEVRIGGCMRRAKKQMYGGPFLMYACMCL